MAAQRETAVRTSRHFRGEVIDRLFALNAELHTEERRLGLVDKNGKPSKKTKAGAKKATARTKGQLQGGLFDGGGAS